jgi:thioredoxin reductase (NADPH)
MVLGERKIYGSFAVTHRDLRTAIAMFANDKIAVIWDSTVEEVLGTTGFPPAVTGIRIRNLKTGKVNDLNVDGVFVAIGHAPAVAFLGGQLRMKPNGYVWTAPDSTATSIAGVFAAGDVTDDTFRQAVTAAGLGCMAALEAEKFLAMAAEPAEAAE